MPYTAKALYYPTYASYREKAEGETLAEVGASITFYRERCQDAASASIRACYADALRAYEDELLAREYCTRHDDPGLDTDDPFFEAEVREYEPGDMIDFGC